MKSITKILLIPALPAAMFAATSCLNDEPLIDWDEVKDHYVIELADNDHAQAENNMEQGDVAEFMIIVNYTASYAHEVTEDIHVTLGVDLDTIQKINAGLTASEQPFEPFTAESYAGLQTEVTIPAGCKKDTVFLNVDLNEDFKVGMAYILPIKIKGASDGYLISGNFGHLELEINMAEPQVGLKVVSEDKDDPEPNVRRNVRQGDEVIFDIELSVDYNVTIQEPVTAGLFIDPSRVVILDASSDKDYEILSSEDISKYFTVTPDLAVNIYPEKEGVEDPEPTEVTIEGGQKKTSIQVKANTSIMEPGKNYILPIEIDHVTEHYAIGSGNLIYLEVNMDE